MPSLAAFPRTAASVRASSEATRPIGRLAAAFVKEARSCLLQATRRLASLLALDFLPKHHLRGFAALSRFRRLGFPWEPPLKQGPSPTKIWKRSRVRGPFLLREFRAGPEIFAAGRDLVPGRTAAAMRSPALARPAFVAAPTSSVSVRLTTPLTPFLLAHSFGRHSDAHIFQYHGSGRASRGRQHLGGHRLRGGTGDHCLECVAGGFAFCRMPSRTGRSRTRATGPWVYATALLPRPIPAGK
jgi:hypothetical protein